jgi:hypothetical protein
VRFAVESWSPDYGSPIDDAALEPSTAEVDAGVEVPVEQWAPRSVTAEPVADLLFVDGVRRVEAHVWITDDEGREHQGVCASYAAGAVRCTRTAAVVEARLVEARVERTLFSTVAGAEPIVTRHALFGVHVAVDGEGADLPLLLQRAMGDLELRVAAAAGSPDQLVVVDGPLRPGQTGLHLVGYVKTHRAAYGPEVVGDVVRALAVGQRTPLLLLGGLRNRYTCYLRLPVEVRHGWAGIVRLEVSADQPVADAAAQADRLAATLGRFASHETKDARAPQNLYPIAGLERELRRRLGDPALLFRALRSAAHAA